jgi:hypothetical protein
MPRTEIRLPDWPFGAACRRGLLDAVLAPSPPANGWTKTKLEGEVGVGPGGLDEVLAGAMQLGLVQLSDGRWRVAQKLPPIATPLRLVLNETRLLPNSRILPLPTRPYRRHS